MLQVAFGVLVAAVVAAVLGFGGIVGAAIEIAEVLFLAFAVLFFTAVVRERRAAR